MALVVNAIADGFYLIHWGWGLPMENSMSSSWPGAMPPSVEAKKIGASAGAMLPSGALLLGRPLFAHDLAHTQHIIAARRPYHLVQRVPEQKTARQRLLLEG